MTVLFVRVVQNYVDKMRWEGGSRNMSRVNKNWKAFSPIAAGNKMRIDRDCKMVAGALLGNLNYGGYVFMLGQQQLKHCLYNISMNF